MQDAFTLVEVTGDPDDNTAAQLRGPKRYVRIAVTHDFVANVFCSMGVVDPSNEAFKLVPYAKIASRCLLLASLEFPGALEQTFGDSFVDPAFFSESFRRARQAYALDVPPDPSFEAWARECRRVVALEPQDFLLSGQDFLPGGRAGTGAGSIKWAEELSFNPPGIEYTWPLGLSIFYQLAGEDSSLPGSRKRDSHFNIVMNFLHDAAKEQHTFLESLPHNSRGKHLVRMLQDTNWAQHLQGDTSSTTDALDDIADRMRWSYGPKDMRELVVAKRSHLIAGSSIQGLSDILLGVHTTAEASELMERLRKWQDARVKRTRPHEDFTLDSDAAILALGEELTKPSVRAVYSQAAFSGGGAEKARRRVEALEAYSDEVASVGAAGIAAKTTEGPTFTDQQETLLDVISTPSALRHEVELMALFAGGAPAYEIFNRICVERNPVYVRLMLGAIKKLTIKEVFLKIIDIRPQWPDFFHLSLVWDGKEAVTQKMLKFRACKRLAEKMRAGEVQDVNFVRDVAFYVRKQMQFSGHRPVWEPDASITNGEFRREEGKYGDRAFFACGYPSVERSDVDVPNGYQAIVDTAESFLEAGEPFSGRRRVTHEQHVIEYWRHATHEVGKNMRLFLKSPLPNKAVPTYLLPTTASCTATMQERSFAIEKILSLHEYAGGLLSGVHTLHIHTAHSACPRVPRFYCAFSPCVNSHSYRVKHAGLAVWRLMGGLPKSAVS